MIAFINKCYASATTNVEYDIEMLRKYYGTDLNYMNELDISYEEKDSSIGVILYSEYPYNMIKLADFLYYNGIDFIILGHYGSSDNKYYNSRNIKLIFRQLVIEQIIVDKKQYTRCNLH
jgi:hypothetical protein